MKNFIQISFEHEITPRVEDISSLLYHIDNLSNVLTLASQEEYKDFDFAVINGKSFIWHNIRQKVKPAHKLTIEDMQLHSPLEIKFKSPFAVVIICLGLSLSNISETSRNISETILNLEKTKELRLNNKNKEQMNQLISNLEENEDIREMLHKLLSKIQENPSQVRDIHKEIDNSKGFSR